MSDEIANSIFDKSKLRGKFEDSGKVIEGTVFFSFLYKFLTTLDEKVIGDSCIEDVYDKSILSGKEDYLRNGLEMVTRALFKNRNVEKDLKEILESSISDIVAPIKRHEVQYAEEEGKNNGEEDQKYNEDVTLMVSKAFVYILLRERLDHSMYKKYLDKVKDDFNENTKDHLKKIGISERIYIFEGESNVGMEIYDYIRVVMFATSKLIPDSLTKN
ncbi:putative exportin [Encephalitozoon intestinalis]